MLARDGSSLAIPDKPSAHEGHAAGEPGFYGFAMARQIRDVSGARQLIAHGTLYIAHGTLYKALARLEQAGLLTSSWEDPGLAEAERRPRRRLYRVTPSAEQAVLRSTGQRASTAPRPGLGLAPACHGSRRASARLPP